MADYKDPEKHAYPGDDLAPTTTHRRGSITDAVFGEITEDGPNYRAVCSVMQLRHYND